MPKVSVATLDVHLVNCPDTLTSLRGSLTASTYGLHSCHPCHNPPKQPQIEVEDATGQNRLLSQGDIA